MAYYNGHARDIYGKPIGTENRPGSFTGVSLDPRNPPVFDSQAAYLDRHGLFLPGERKRLGKADFADFQLQFPRYQVEHGIVAGMCYGAARAGVRLAAVLIKDALSVSEKSVRRHLGQVHS